MSIAEYHTPEYSIIAHPIERECWDDVWQRITMETVGFTSEVRIRREGLIYRLTPEENERLRVTEPDAFVAALREREPDDFFIPEGATIKSMTITYEPPP